MITRPISVDDHVSEGPSVWVTRVPANMKDEVPQVRDVDGISTWFIKGEKAFQAGWAKDKQEIEKRKSSRAPFGTRPGDWDPVERLKDYDLDGTEAAVIYPNFCRFHGNPLEQVKDVKVRLECIKAYNDWLSDEFCATNAKRLVPVALIPPWDVDLAVAEAARVARKGYRVVLFGPALDIFGYKPTFDRYWDPLYATLEEAGMILSFHQPSAAMDRAYFQDPKNPVPGAIKTALNVAHTHSLIYPTAELLLSGILERFPKLKVFLAEAGVSWIPYTLSQADYWWPRNGRWDNNELRMPPSMYWKRQCSAGFWLDYVSPTVVREVGEDNVMWEADYLHTLTTFPQSRFYQEKSLVEITDQTLREKILWGNAEKLFGIK